MLSLISDNSAIIILGLFAVNIIVIALLITIFVKFGKVNKKYNKFMTGSDANNLEKVILSRFSEIDKIKIDTANNKKEIDVINEQLQSTYQKIGVVKYDAFKEMGGKLSFVLVLLDMNNNGFLMNSMHSSREGCYTYLKEIIKGESFLELSGEETKALEEALNSTNYME